MGQDLQDFTGFYSNISSFLKKLEIFNPLSAELFTLKHLSSVSIRKSLLVTYIEICSGKVVFYFAEGDCGLSLSSGKRQKIL